MKKALFIALALTIFSLQSAIAQPETAFSQRQNFIHETTWQTCENNRAENISQAFTMEFTSDLKVVFSHSTYDSLDCSGELIKSSIDDKDSFYYLASDQDHVTIQVINEDGMRGIGERDGSFAYNTIRFTELDNDQIELEVLETAYWKVHYLVKSGPTRASSKEKFKRIQ